VKYHEELIYTEEKKKRPDTGINLQSCYTRNKIGVVHTDTLVETNAFTSPSICNSNVNLEIPD